MPAPKEERTVEIIVNGTKANASLKEMGAAAAVLSNQVAKIAADDPKRAELIAQLQTMRQRIGDARAEIAGLLTAEQQAAVAEQKLAEAIAATAAEQERAIAAQQQAIVVGKSSTASFTEMRTAAGLLEKQLHELSAADPGRAALIKDYQSLQARMGEARAEMTRVVKTEQELRAEQDALRASQERLVVNGQKVSASMREMREAAAQLEKELESLGQNDPARGPLIAALQEMRVRIKQVNEEVAGVAQTTSRMKQVMTNAFAFAVGGGIEQGIEKVVEMGKSIFTTTAKFETYGVVLEKALGSKSLAQKALADIQKMAAETPFSVDELTSSFLKFVNRGLTPSMAEMTKLGDLASSQGKSFDQLTEAVLDAGTGEFERLKEFGISASKSGDQVSLSFKGVNQTVANTPAAIQGAILAMGEMKGVAGGMAAIAKSLDGQLSNVGDTADQVAVQWGQVLRPVFVAVLSTIGFLLGALGALPGFIKENRAAFIGLGVALVTLNAEQIILNGLVLANTALEKGRAIAIRASAAAIWLLDAAAAANPLGIMAAAAVVLIGLLVNLYEKSATFRAAVAGMGQALYEFGKTYVQGTIQLLTGLWDMLSFDPAKIKKGLQETGAGLKAIFYDAGKNAAGAYTKGYDEKAATDAKASAEKQANLFDQFAHAYQQRLDAALKARLAAEAAARLEALKNEEAALRLKLAKVKDGSEQEMRLKQQLVTNEAAQQLASEKKTAADKAIILAEAEQKRVKLAQEFYEKQAKEREEARKKAEAAALKSRLAEIEAEKVHKQMLAQVRNAAVVASNGGDELATEMSQIYTEGQMKRAALEAEAQKDIAQLTGTAQEKAKRQLDIEKKLGADLLLVDAEWRQKQGAASDKDNEKTYKKLEEEVERKLATMDEAGEREQAAFEAPLRASLKLQQEYDDLRYRARQANLEEELNLIESTLGKESADYKKVAAKMEKDQQDHNKRKLANEKLTQKQIEGLQKATMQVASDVLSFTLGLLDQDGEARQKHHTLYVALATAKVVVDGLVEVQNIWEQSSGLGPWGVALAVVQTAFAAARTAVAISQIKGTDSSTGGSGYAKGGLTGDGKGLAVSPMGALMQASGMQVGSNGRLMDGSGFAIAGVVHEDEYVIPKWQLADPQVAAVAQWLEARRLRGFADGGATSASSGATLPVAAASPTTDGEKLYAATTQMLDELRTLNIRLAGVEQWQSNLQVNLNLRDTQSGLSELKQVQQAGAIRSKK